MSRVRFIRLLCFLGIIDTSRNQKTSRFFVFYVPINRYGPWIPSPSKSCHLHGPPAVPAVPCIAAGTYSQQGVLEKKPALDSQLATLIKKDIKQRSSITPVHARTVEHRSLCSHHGSHPDAHRTSLAHHRSPHTFSSNFFSALGHMSIK